MSPVVKIGSKKIDVKSQQHLADLIAKGLRKSQEEPRACNLSMTVGALNELTIPSVPLDFALQLEGRVQEQGQDLKEALIFAKLKFFYHVKGLRKDPNAIPENHPLEFLFKIPSDEEKKQFNLIKKMEKVLLNPEPNSPLN